MTKKINSQPIFSATYGETVLTNEEKIGLKLKNVKTKKQLDIAESKNIQKAGKELLDIVLSNQIILDDFWLRKLHKKMFGIVWHWAGQYRTRETNLGIEPYSIARDLRVLCDDAKAWLQYNTYPITEVIIRFHHISVKIHPFPNGNGRWSRMATVCFANANNLKIDWSKINTHKEKKEYISALQKADNNDYQPLIGLMLKLIY